MSDIIYSSEAEAKEAVDAFMCRLYKLEEEFGVECENDEGCFTHYWEAKYCFDGITIQKAGW